MSIKKYSDLWKDNTRADNQKAYWEAVESTSREKELKKLKDYLQKLSPSKFQQRNIMVLAANIDHIANHEGAGNPYC